MASESIPEDRDEDDSEERHRKACAPLTVGPKIAAGSNESNRKMFSRPSAKNTEASLR